MRYIVVLTALALAGCDLRPEHAEWRDVCVESYTQVTYVPQTTYNGTTTTTTIQPMYSDVCTRTEVQCVAGRDGSTTCEGQ